MVETVVITKIVIVAAQNHNNAMPCKNAAETEARIAEEGNNCRGSTKEIAVVGAV